MGSTPFSIALYEPEIPPNTGNIIRLCANTGFDLHLIGQLGFSLDEKPLRRAGLDYHEFARMQHWQSWQEFHNKVKGRLISLSTRNALPYSDFEFELGDILLFGSETKGLPEAVRENVGSEHRLTIPMREHSRSLNLSNSVAIVAYEAWKQVRFV